MTKVSSNLKEKIPVNERQQRGTSLFPLEYNFCNTENPYYDLWLHWHTEFELIHILSGTYNLFLGDHEIVLNKGDSCIIPGKIVHGDAPDKGASKYESAVFDIELLRQHGFSPDSVINDIILENISLKYYIPAEQKDIFTTIAFSYFLIMFYPTALMFKTKNPLKAFFIGVKDLFSRKFFKNLSIFITLVVIYFVLSMLAAIFNNNIVLHFVFTILDFYCKVFVAVLIFDYYYSNYIKVGGNLDERV